MKHKIILPVFALVPLLFVVMNAASVWACIPEDDSGRCMAVPQKRTATPRPAAAAIVKPPTAVPVAAAARGMGPYDALAPSDAWLVMAGNTSLWFKIGEGINRQHLDVWLDAYGKDGIGFAVYSPEQMGDWSPATTPKGRGTPNRSDPTHDLWWIGNAPAGGTWFVVVSNSNPGPIPYKIGYNRTSPAQRDCSGPYWEFLPSGEYVLWPGLCK